LTPVTVDETNTAVAQLARLGIGANDVRTIVLSHFHADHIAGARDFPQAKFVFRDVAYQDVRGLRGFAAVRKAFLPELLPEDFESRMRPIAASSARPNLQPHASLGGGYDLLGDGSLLGIDLPGHAAGHMGLMFEDGNKRRFLIGDAAWRLRNVTELLPPSPVARILMHDWGEYRQTLGALHDLTVAHPEVEIMPCHCETVLAGVRADAVHSLARA
jgi:glyoxylase-like metal-dependent hydrolase (beta-lactamase superfamily II)